MFLTVLVPGPTNPKGKIDVFLQPLIEEFENDVTTSEEKNEPDLDYSDEKK